MKIKTFILTFMCIGLWACGAIAESPQADSTTASTPQDSQQVKKEENKENQTSMSELEDECE